MPLHGSACGAHCSPRRRRTATWHRSSKGSNRDRTVSGSGGHLMWLVFAAMRRPITILVAVVAVALTSIMAIQQMKVDIFPKLGAPAVYVAQPYGGMDPSQMEGYLTYYYEYHFLYITGIEHVESKNIQGVALMKLVFHSDTDMSQAMGEVVGYSNRARAFMPPGAVPPFIMRFDAGSVPVAQLAFSSATRSVAESPAMAVNV